MRTSWPETHIILRGDGHFSNPELMALCESDPHLDFIFGLAGNTVLSPMARPLLERARALHQNENFIKAVKNDLASDRASDHTFLANHLRLFYSCAAYGLIHSLRENTLVHTVLAKAQPVSIILKRFKLAVRVVQYKDRIRLSLPAACPIKGVLARVTELFYLVPRPPAPA